MSKYFKVVIKGALGSSEVWSVNPIFDPFLETTFEWSQTKGDAVVAAFAAITTPAPLLAALSNSGFITSFRLELRELGTDELYGVSEYQLPTPRQGTGELTKAPQTAVVASLRTNTPGASGRGRLYWPALNVAIDGNGFRVPTATVVAINTAFASYLRALSNAILTAASWSPITTMDLVVYSRARGVTYPVNQILTGNVLDIQRRRRDALPETYSRTAYPPA